MNAVQRYSEELIDKDEYDYKVNYYNEMLLDYNEFYHSLRFGKYAYIKDEYKDKLKTYMDENYELKDKL